MQLQIVPYDSEWPAKFERLRATLSEAIRGVEYLAIEHVGSTSVPGCWAKPIIDIDIFVRSAEHLGPVISALEAVGYRHQGDLGIVGREAFKQPVGLPRHHLYLGVVGARPLVEHLAFRVFLRSDPRVVAEYGELKVRLATEFEGNWDGYTEAKTSFIRGHLGRLALESGSGPQ